MFIVTTAADGRRAGCLVGFATQASIDPPRFLVGLSDKNHTYRVATRAQRLVVHALGRERLDLARLFGERTGDETDKFAARAWHADGHGLPVLDDAAGWFSGPILDRRPMGDHVGFLVEPDDGAVRADTRGRLLSFADVGELNPGHGA